MDYSTRICRQNVLDTIMSSSRKFRAIQTDACFLNFNRQIEAEHEKLTAKYFSSFKKISRDKGISEANKEISIKILHDYNIYMQIDLQDKEADEAYEILDYFRLYPVTDIFISRQDIQTMMSSDFPDNIGFMIDNMWILRFE